MHFLTALVTILLALYIGEVVSVKTKAFVPSVFVTAVIFLVGYWTVFPKDIVDLAGFQSVIVNVVMYMLIVNMGTMLSSKELLEQWKIILIAVGGIVGICVMCLTLGSILVGRQEAIISTPPLAGGIVAAIIMSDAAKAIGDERLSVLAIVIYVMQGFAGYPLTSLALKKEGNRLLQEMKSGNRTSVKTVTENQTVQKKKLIPAVPSAYDSDVLKLLKMALLGFCAYWTHVVLLTYLKIEIHPLVIALIYGVIGRELGFVAPNPLKESNSFGLAITILMAFIFGSLNRATPEMLASIAKPLIGIIVLGVIGMAITSVILGKVFKISTAMAFAVSLTALYGFPANYIITTEVVKSLAKNEEESKYLTDGMLPKMLVGGFTTVTIVSVLLAGAFVKLL